MGAVCCWCATALVQADIKGSAAWVCPQPACLERQIRHAFVSKTKRDPQPRYRNVPLPKQVEFRERRAKHKLFGGAAGPGKSHEARWALYELCSAIPGFEALLLRETFGELERTHMRRMEAEQELIGAEFSRTAHLMRFPGTKSLIELGHMEDGDAVRKYLSTEYDAIVCDEGSLYPPDALLELSTRARTSKPQVLRVGGAQFWVVTNPGGPSSQLLLDFFIDHQPDFEAYPALQAKYRPEQWAFIPALLDDNPYIDPEYESTLAVLKPWRFQQLRYGNFRVFAGQFFPTWQEPRHVVDLEVPSGVQWFRSMDWGFNAPGCVLWWAVLGDGHLYIRRDLKFQQDDVSEVARKIKKVDRELGVPTAKTMTYGDPAMWAKTGLGVKGRIQGESIGQTLAALGVPMIAADNDRYNGWTRCHQILRDDSQERPWLQVHSDAKYLIRSIPGAKSDKKDPDDVDTNLDDHALDAWRYGAMSRPAPRTGSQPKVKPPVGSPAHDMQRWQQKTGRQFGRVA